MGVVEGMVGSGGRWKGVEEGGRIPSDESMGKMGVFRCVKFSLSKLY